MLWSCLLADDEGTGRLAFAVFWTTEVTKIVHKSYAKKDVAVIAAGIAALSARTAYGDFYAVYTDGAIG